MNVVRFVGCISCFLLVGLTHAFGHERQEVAGLEVVLGAEPEPPLNGEKQFLRWRFLKDKQPVGDIEELSATIVRNGKRLVPLPAE